MAMAYGFQRTSLNTRLLVQLETTRETERNREIEKEREGWEKGRAKNAKGMYSQ